jgi:hypothetical protein
MSPLDSLSITGVYGLRDALRAARVPRVDFILRMTLVAREFGCRPFFLLLMTTSGRGSL